jgi:hypothetical protein
MATDLGQGKVAPTAKYEAFVLAQLARTGQRIRALDLTAALLVFVAGTLAYAVTIALLDRWLDLAPSIRQAACVVYLLTSVVYLTVFVVLPLSRRINPYFAARQLERTLPGAKNSVVNWLDLHDEDLLPAIRGAVGQRAARDLGRADLEKAVNARRTYLAAAVAAVCALAFLIAFFAFGPGLFLGYVGRAFAPFGASGKAALPTATRLTVVKPADGNAVVPDDRPFEMLVRVDGRAPNPKAADALKMLFRYQPTAAYQQRLLEADDGGRWGVTLAANDVQDGFWYKITGGDAETPEYRVRLTARVVDFKAVYQFRPYLARANETRLDERKIEAVRGTKVDVTVHVNRDVKDGWLQFEGAKGVTVAHGERLPGDPQGFVVPLTLDESSQYRVCFTATDGENFVEPQAYPLVAVPDKAPIVALTKPVELKEKPGWVSPLHANDLLQLEGTATDDIGVAEMWLNLKVDNGPVLPRQEYRSPKEFQLPHGGNPTAVDYKDFVDLAKVRSPADPAFVVRPGMVLEYWLSAKDACDFPAPNVGESKHYRVQIVDALNNDKVQKENRDKAQADKTEQQQKQDEQNKKDDEKRQADNKQKEQQGNGGSGGDKGENKPKENGGQGDKPKEDSKPKENGGQSDKAKEDGKQPQENGGQSDKPKEDDKQQSKPGEDSKNGTGEPKASDKGNQSKPDNSKASDKGNQGKPDNSAEKGSKPNEGKPDDASGKGSKPSTDQQSGGAKSEDVSKDLKNALDELQKAKEGAGKNNSGQQPKPSDDKKGDGQPAKKGGDSKAQPGAQPDKGNDDKSKATPQPGPDKANDKPGDQKKPEGAKSPSDGSPADKNVKPPADPSPMDKGKPTGEKPDKSDAAPSKTDGDSPGETSPKEATPKDVADAAKDLKSPDPQKRQKAAKKLGEIAQTAKDEQARKDAKDALKDADAKAEEGNKPKEGSSDSVGKPMEPKEKPGDDKAGKGGEPSPMGAKTPMDNPKEGADKGNGQTQGKKKPMTDKTAPGQSGPGNKHTNNRPDEKVAEEPSSKPATPEKPVEQNASVLQLRKFLEAVDPKVLADAKVDPAKWKQLEDQARKYLKDHPPTDAKETLAGSRQSPLNNTAGKVSNSAGQTPTADSDNGGRALPPPGYRDTYKEFTKELSKPMPKSK